MTKRKATLDFALLPKITYGYSHYMLSEKTIGGLTDYSEIISRVEGCAHFILNISKQEKTVLKEANLRAALAEIVSIEDVISCSSDSKFVGGRLYKLNSSLNPLLHIIRELRNLNIHIKTNPFVTRKMSVSMGNFENQRAAEDSQAFELNIWYINDVEPSDFQKLNNASAYTKEEVEKMLGWFNSAQKEYGIGDIIYRGLIIYLEEIRKHYGVP